MGKSILTKIDSMKRGGQALARVRDLLQNSTVVGTTFEEIEQWAKDAITNEGMKPSFSTVPNYHWATCVMLNDALCHGIPKNGRVKDGDLVTIDVGLICDGFHLDTTTSFLVGKANISIQQFLEVGRSALRNAIKIVKPGCSVYQVSRAMEKTVLKHGFGVVYQLTGHGVGEELHMDPAIPCCATSSDKKVFFKEGQTLAIEIMYTQGSPDLIVNDDGWTYRTLDGSLSAMFEDTVLVTKNGFEILTKVN